MWPRGYLLLAHTLLAGLNFRAVGRGGAGGARAPPIILTGPLWNNCTIVCELATALNLTVYQTKLLVRLSTLEIYTTYQTRGNRKQLMP